MFGNSKGERESFDDCWLVLKERFGIKHGNICTVHNATLTQVVRGYSMLLPL